MNCISDRIMAYKKIKWSAGALKYPPHVLEEVNNTKNELDGDINAVDEDISDANQQEVTRMHGTCVCVFFLSSNVTNIRYGWDGCDGMVFFSDVPGCR